MHLLLLLPAALLCADLCAAPKPEMSCPGGAGCTVEFLLHKVQRLTDKEKTLRSTNCSHSRPAIGPHSHANDGKRTNPMAQQATMTRPTSCREERVTAQGPVKKTMQGDPRSTSHSRGIPTTGPHAHTNEAICTGPTAEKATMTQRTLRREECPGPVRNQRRTKCHTAGMHRGNSVAKIVSETSQRSADSYFGFGACFLL